MDQSINVLSAICKAHTVPQRVMDCGYGLGGLNQVYWPDHPTLSAQSISDKYNIFMMCTIRNQLDILMTALANVRKWQPKNIQMTFSHGFCSHLVK